MADGTRFVKVKFTDEVQSLPYSTKFNTATGQQYFRVIHDRQVKVCRICIQPGHILRECPDFVCFKCGLQGHYARECNKNIQKCKICFNITDRCICNDSISDVEQSDSVEEEESDMEEECVSAEEVNLNKDAAIDKHNVLNGQQPKESDKRREGTRKMGPTSDRVKGLTEKGGARKMGPALNVAQSEGDSCRERATSDSSEKKAQNPSTGSCIPDSCLSLFDTQMAVKSLEANSSSLSSSAKSISFDSDSEMDFADVVSIRKRQNVNKLKREMKKSKNKLNYV